jgi:hypothetical protein
MDEHRAPAAPPLRHNPTSQEIRRAIKAQTGQEGLRALHRLLARLPRAATLSEQEQLRANADAAGTQALGLPPQLFLSPSAALELTDAPKGNAAGPRSNERADAPGAADLAGFDALREEPARVHLFCLGRAPDVQGRAGKERPTAPRREKPEPESSAVLRGRDVNARYRLKNKEGIVWAAVTPRLTRTHGATSRNAAPALELV